MTMSGNEQPSCINCGSEPGCIAICESCGNDPFLLSDDRDGLESVVTRDGTDHVRERLLSDDERRALWVALPLMAILSIAFTGLSLGSFAVLLAAAIGMLFITRAKTRSTLVRVTDNSFAIVFQLSKTAAYRLNMPPVEVFIRESPHLNAHTSGVGSQSWIVLESALVEALSPDELLFVLGHELGHVKQRHVVWQLLMGNSEGTRVPLVTQLFRVVFSGWSREAEFTADRAGYLATGDLMACCNALIKMLAGPNATSQVSVERHLDSMRSQSEIENALAEILSTHPLEGHRILALQSFATDLD
jgi:Zn-dependent protease with chaperone function